MRIFKIKWFDEFADKNGIHDEMLVKAVERAERGLIDANLGGGVIKQRIAREGQGKSRGYRTLILFRKGERAFFIYGFSKNDRDNVCKNEEEDLKDMAKFYLSVSENHLSELLSKGVFVEVNKNG